MATSQGALFDGDQPGLRRTAQFSACERYRYRLSRRWSDGRAVATWIMLNPSTADAFKEDPTIRRCISFSRAWGYDALEIVNLFALRSPLPTSLNRAIADGVDPVGSENNAAIVDACSIASHVYAAWGAYPLADARARAVFDLPEFEPHRDRLFCLGCTFGGRPRHPLYVAAMTEPIKFRFPEFD